jgi:hypothetical protein
MGLGLYSPVGQGANPFVGHDGDTGGFHSTLALLPQAHFGLFVSYNSDGIPQRLPAAAELVQLIAARYFPDVKPASGTVADIVVAGTYAPARRVDSTMFKLRALVEQVAVRREGDRFTIRPAIVPFGEPLEAVEPGLFRWSGRDVSFAEAGPSAVMQLGSPPAQLRPVQWWASAGVVLPALVVCLLTAGLAVVSWPLSFLRSRSRPSIDARTRRLRSATRLALLLNLGAIVASLWLVMAGWPLVAVSSPLVVPVVLGIYAAAWLAGLIAPLSAWYVVRLARGGAGAWVVGREAALAAVVLMLTAFCLYFRIAGIRPL